MRPSFRAASKYAEVLTHVNEALFYKQLNSTNRKLLFRPSRARELHRQPVKINDQEYSETVEFPGYASSSSLSTLIGLVETSEQWSEIKDVVIGYAEHQPNSLKPHHLSKFLRSGNSVGKFGEALTFASSASLRSKVSPEFFREALRLKLARHTLSPETTPVKPETVEKWFQRGSFLNRSFSESFDSNLLMAALVPGSVHLKKVEELLSAHQTAESLVNGAVYGNSPAFSKAQFLLVDLTLAIPILSSTTAAASLQKLQTELKSLVGPSDVTAKYIEEVSKSLAHKEATESEDAVGKEQAE